MAMKYVTGGFLAIAALVSIVAASIGVHDARKRGQEGRKNWATSALIANLILGMYVVFKLFFAKDARGKAIGNRAIGAISGAGGYKTF